MVRAEQAHKWNGDIWLVVTLPDGYPGRVRLTETDLDGSNPARESVVSTTLSVDGIRALRALVARLQGRTTTGVAP